MLHFPPEQPTTYASGKWLLGSFFTSIYLVRATIPRHAPTHKKVGMGGDVCVWWGKTGVHAGGPCWCADAGAEQEASGWCRSRPLIPARLLVQRLGLKFLTKDLGDGTLCAPLELLELLCNIPLQIPIHFPRRQIEQVHIGLLELFLLLHHR